MSATGTIPLPPVRPLTPAQRGRLQGIAADDDEARVVGWSEPHEGPVVARGDGRQTVITPRGRSLTQAIS